MRTPEETAELDRLKDAFARLREAVLAALQEGDDVPGRWRAILEHGLAEALHAAGPGRGDAAP